VRILIINKRDKDSIINEDVPIIEDKESDKDTISLSEFGFDETKSKRALQEELKSDILIRMEIELKNQLSQYEKELSQKLENVLLEGKKKQEQELSLQNEKLKEVITLIQKVNSQEQEEEEEIEKLKKEEAKLKKEIHEKIKSEIEEEINNLKDEYSSLWQQLEQKNNICLDQQLQDLRLGRVADLEEEKNVSKSDK